MKKLLMLEFNELCPEFIERFIDQGHLPNFKKLRDDAEIRYTDADAEGEDLNPWIQWMDIHSGLHRKEHGLNKLNEAKKFGGDFTWDVLQKNFGVKSWICGSMNASYGSGFSGRFLPDPWTNDVVPRPKEEMENYYYFVSQSVHGHTNKKEHVSSSSFIKSVLKQGLSFSTLKKLVFQICHEKLVPESTWKRAMILDWIQSDIFVYYYLKEQPQFSTFFSNCVAHYQHHYWRDFEPEKFNLNGYKPQKEKSKAILMGYKNTDKILGKMLGLVGNDSAIILATGLSQQPYTKNERHYYHITNESSFKELFGIPLNAKYRPVMAEQFHLHFENEKTAVLVKDQLDEYIMESNDFFHEGSNKVFKVSREKNILHIQCRCSKIVPKEAFFFKKPDPDHKIPFYDAFYKMSETKSGVHNPIGIYWFRKPSHDNERVSDKHVRPAQIHNDIIEYFS